MRNKGKKRRKARRKWCFLLCMVVFCMVFLRDIEWTAQNGSVGVDNSDVIVVNTDLDENYKYELEKPQVLEGEDIKEMLLKLTQKYPEFTEIYENYDAYPEELLAALCNNPEMIDFVKGYLTASGEVTGGFSEAELEERFPLFIQWDERWGYSAYGDNNMALSGCAPTCISMVIVALTQNTEATPDYVAKYAMENGYYHEGVGTKWSIMTDGVQDFGIKGEEIPLNKNTIFDKLKAGSPIICSMRQGDFTSMGHFIVLTGIVDGKIVVNDPNSRIRSSILWDYDTLDHQIKNLWVFRKSS